MMYLKEKDTKELFRSVRFYLKKRQEIESLKHRTSSQLISLLTYGREAERLESEMLEVCRYAGVKMTDMIKLSDMVIVNGITSRDQQIFNAALRVMIAEHANEMSLTGS